MSDLEITKGEWIVEKCNCGHSCCDKHGLSNGTFYQGSGFIIEDAELIADAGNTAQKCGLLPSELLEQKNEVELQLSICEETLETSERLRMELMQRVDELRLWKKEQIEIVEPLLEKLKKRKVVICATCNHRVKGKYCGLNGKEIGEIYIDSCNVWEERIEE